VYTNVEKYGLVFRERKLTAAAYQPPEETTVDAPTFFDTALDGVTRISKSSRLVVPGVDLGTVPAFFPEKVPTCLPPLTFSRPPNVIHPSSASE
jgi:hypothetical protein